MLGDEGGVVSTGRKVNSYTPGEHTRKTRLLGKERNDVVVSRDDQGDYQITCGEMSCRYIYIYMVCEPYLSNVCVRVIYTHTHNIR